jgi:hypothetical protein
MNKLIALTAVMALASASCSKKKKAPDSVAATDTMPLAQPIAGAAAADPMQAAVAAATSAVTKGLAPAPSSVRAKQIAKVIDRTAELAAPAGSHARAGWDPSAVIAMVGKDRGPLFSWVRDHTALVPYRGSLRGAVGVMMDRVGNSLDRSLLLAELLERSGLEVRLARAQLDDAAVAMLAKRWAERPRPALPPAELAGEPWMTRLTADLGVDAGAFRKRISAAESEGEKLLARTRARIAEQSTALAKLIPAPAGRAAAASAPSAFADHWWVQVRDGEAWSELDPALPDAAPGETLAPAASETVLPAELADEHRHLLTVRVIAEIWHGDSREETTLLEHTFAPARFYGQRVSVSNAPVDLPDTGTLLAAADPARAVRVAVAAQTEWIPMLQIGRTPVVKMSVTDAGELYDVTDPNGNTNRLARAVQRATKAGVGGATDLLGSLPDDSESPPAALPAPADTTGFSAQWIEFEVRVPGAEPTRTRRVVFDALGLHSGDRSAARPAQLSTAARLDRALALVGETELLPMFARIPESFVVNQTAATLTASRAALIELVNGTGSASQQVREQIAAAPALPGTLYALALARFAWSRVGDQVYLERINVLTQRKRMTASETGMRALTIIDIIDNAVAVWPTVGIDPRRTRIEQGVADTAAEAVLVDCPPTSCNRGLNTSDLFDASAGKGWEVTTASAVASATANAGVAADLGAGFAVLAAPRSTTWWRVHAETGETLGMSPAGGSVSGETVVQLIVTGINGVGCFANLAPPAHEHGLQLMGCVIGTGIGFIGGLVGALSASYRAAGWATVILSALITNVAPRF